MWKSVISMEYTVAFQNEKFQIIEFLGHLYINLPKEGLPYIAFNEEKFYPIMGFFSSKCDIKIIINDESRIVLFFDKELPLTEVVNFTNLVSAQSTTIMAITNDDYDTYLRVLINI